MEKRCQKPWEKGGSFPMIYKVIQAGKDLGINVDFIGIKRCCFEASGDPKEINPYCDQDQGDYEKNVACGAIFYGGYVCGICHELCRWGSKFLKEKMGHYYSRINFKVRSLAEFFMSF